jgi:hypothetical protein
MDHHPRKRHTDLQNCSYALCPSISHRNTKKQGESLENGIPQPVDSQRKSREPESTRMLTFSISEEQARLLLSKRENEAVLAKQALAYTSRVIGYIRKLEKTLAGDTGPTPAKIEIKEEIKSETRDSRSPSPNQLAKTRQLIFTKRPRPSSRISLTRSMTPRVPAPLGSERTTSMAETEAILTVQKNEETSSDPIPRANNKRTGDEVKPVLDPTKPKKRPRPSFPPREGPDYTRPLPHAPSKKLNTFGLSDLKR